MTDLPPPPTNTASWQTSRAARVARRIAAPGHSVQVVGWDLLLVVVAIHIANYIGRVPQLFPVLAPLKPALIVKVVAIGLYLLHQSGRRRMGLLRSRTTFCILGLLLWSGLSVTDALYPGLAFKAWIDLGWTVLMYSVIAGSVRTVRDVGRLVFVYFSVTVLYVAVVLSRFQLSPDNWRLGSLYYYDANDLATLIVSAMPCGLYFVLGRHRPLVRACAVLGLAVLALGLTRSGSRGGFLAFLAVIAFILVGFTTLPARARLVGLVAVLLVVFATASDRYWTEMQTIVNHQDYNVQSDRGRLKVWERGLGYMADRPVLGVGISNFFVAEGTISPLAKRAERGSPVYWTAPHNIFVQVGAELGVPGLLLFVGLFAAMFVSLRRVARHARSTGPPAGDL